ncbi:hypothetical protein L7F22_002777 [Adiantum nelumboides]|nr:hypothetical protein [Adiantum nelumboides]
MVFKLLYEDDAFTKFYHMEVNKDANVNATSWTDANGYKYRTITFKPQLLDVPKILQRILGADLSPVTELQECRIAGKTFVIHSKLEVMLPGNSTFLSSGDTILSPLDTGCEIVIKLTLDLQTGYLQERLENYAKSEAMAALKRWLNIARVFCERRLGMKEEPLPDEVAGANSSPEETDLNFDMNQMEGEETAPISQNCNEAPSISRRRKQSRLWLIQVVWRRFCAIVWRIYGNLRQPNFLLKAWIPFGLGIVAGLTLGFAIQQAS